MSRARRPRALSVAERDLWHDWARRTRVVPLPGKTIEAAPPAGPAPVTTATPPAALALSGPALPVRPAIPAEIHVGVAPSGLDDRRWRDLRRGRTQPERTLDLHGYRAQDAHLAVRGFVRQAAAEGLRCIAIVTGRGSSPDGGVLRRELPHWLNASDLRPLLLGAAHPHAANAGAVHLLLRRTRPGTADPAAARASRR
jgi:DNA-nicking Smr family endonuclease